MKRHSLSPDSKITSANATVLDKPGGNKLRRVDRDRKANALRRKNHRRIDSDNIAARGNERASGVPWVESSVCLDDVVDQAARVGAERAPQSADHTGGHRALESVRVPY